MRAPLVLLLLLAPLSCRTGTIEQDCSGERSALTTAIDAARTCTSAEQCAEAELPWPGACDVVIRKDAVSGLQARLSAHVARCPRADVRGCARDFRSRPSCVAGRCQWSGRY